MKLKTFDSTYKIIRSKDEERIELLPLHLEKDPDDEEEEDELDDEPTIRVERDPLEENHINSFRIILLNRIPVSDSFYTDTSFEVMLRREDEEFWHGIPLRNRTLGILKWSKGLWYKVYDFEMAMNLKTYYK